MKNFSLSAISVLLFTAGAFAQVPAKLEILNSNYPQKKIEIECANLECSSLHLSYIYDETLKTKKDLSKAQLDNIAKTKILVKDRQVQEGDCGQMQTYNWTETASRRISLDWKEGYELKAVGKTLVTGLAALAETALLPVVGLDAICGLEFNSSHNMNQKKAVKKIISSLEGETIQLEYKEREFNQFMDLFDYI